MNWLKQAPDKPLFPDVLWSRPENRRHAGKLLIIGGHKQAFNEVSAAYSAALKAGIGTARVILPDCLQKMLHKLFAEAEYAASTPIGSFSRQALGTLLDAAQWADAVLLAGDFGKNSETAILLESFIEKYAGKLALAGDSLDYFLAQSAKLAKRPQTLIIANIAQIQKLAAPSLIQQNADFIKVVEQVSDWISKTDLAAVTIHSNQAIIAADQQISTSPVKISTPDVNLAAYATVWYLQQPERAFEALTSAIFCYQQ
jgi:NAD(P)H-hydrate repair Nnr-like enzyme with NAD(P)H-hydrate dehydratase domain